MAKTPWKIKDKKEYPKLEEDKEAEVLVIGGGLCGAWCAYLLAKEGKKVVLAEAKKVGGGATEYTTAFITADIDTSLANLVSMFGSRVAKLVWRSHSDALELISETVHKNKIRCEFSESPVRVYAESEEEFKELQKEQALAEKFGFDTVLRKRIDTGFKHRGVWEIKHQAKYHPLKFLFGLLKLAEKSGADIFEKTRIEKIEGRGPFRAITEDNKVIKARSVIIATYEPIKNTSTHLKKGMYVSYVLEALLPKGKVPEGMYLDLKDPYNYFRIDPHTSRLDRMIIGGADHRSEIKMSHSKNFKALEEYMRNLFPMTKIVVSKRWTGPILEPSDGLALIGAISPGQYAATAFSGNGMTYSAIAGSVIRDIILGKKNPYIELYNPKRPMKAKALLIKAKDYGNEFLGGAIKNIFK
jgi:glycine/D-amino acid oxidase-like deaminating enzyme